MGAYLPPRRQSSQQGKLIRLWDTACRRANLQWFLRSVVVVGIVGSAACLVDSSLGDRLWIVFYDLPSSIAEAPSLSRRAL